MADAPASVDARARPSRGALLRLALGGAVLVCLTRLLAPEGPLPLADVLALALLGVVPLALAAAPPAGGNYLVLHRILALLLPLGALLALGALFRPTGPAGPWMTGWVGVALLVGALGLFHFFGRPGPRLDAFLVAVAFGTVPVAAVWLTAHRMGYRLLGLDAPTLLHTSLHLHFAALALPILAVRAARVLPGRAWPLVARGAAVGVLLGQLLLIFGLRGGASLTLAGAVAQAIALLTVGAASARTVPRLTGRWARGLLGVAAASCLLAAPLAAAWAARPLWDAGGWLDLGSMLRVHGYASAHGVAFSGLLAWTLEDRAAAPPRA